MVLPNIDPLKRFKVHFDAGKPKRQYTLEFYQKYRRSVDPTRSIKALWSKPTFYTSEQAVHHAENIINDLQTNGSTLTSLSSSTRNQILSFAVELSELDHNPANILYEAIQIAKDGGDPLKSIEKGRKLYRSAKEYIDYTFKQFIDLYESDPYENQNRKHSSNISRLRMLDGLGELKIDILVDPEVSVQSLKEVYLNYMNRDTVTRKNTVLDIKRRVDGLLVYIRSKAQIPTLDDLKEIRSLKKYRLPLNSLKDSRPNNTFFPAEVLTLIKLLSRESTFEPALPILGTFMGCRSEMYRHLKYDHFASSDHRGSWQISIPNELTKLGRQHRTVEDISFPASAVPCLPIWLTYLYCKWQESKHEATEYFKHYSHETISDILNKVINEYSSMFYYAPKDGSRFTYGSIYTNAFRNTFFTLGLKHPVVSLNCSKIGNDYKSHIRYNNPNISEVLEESMVLFSLTPDMLNLVNLNNKTVDTAFLYADIDLKIKMYNEESNEDTKLIYESVIESLGYTSGMNDKSSDFHINPDSPVCFEYEGEHLAWYLLPNFYESKKILSKYYNVSPDYISPHGEDDPLNIRHITELIKNSRYGFPMAFKESDFVDLSDE